MKKAVCLLLSLTFLFGLFTGCTSTTVNPTANTTNAVSTTKTTSVSSATSNAATTSSAPEISGEIVIMHYLGGDAKNNLWATFMAEFSKKYPKVTFDSSGTSYANYMPLIRTKASAGDMPDFFMATPIKVSDIVDAGKAMDLKKAGLISQLPLESNVYNECQFSDGGIYGMPYTLKVFSLYYNKDIFAKYDIKPPQKQSELLAICKKLKDNGVDPFIRGNKDYTNLYVDLKCELVPLLQENMHGDYYGKLMSGEKKFSDYPEFRTAVDNLLVRYQWERLDDLTNDGNKVAELFAQGNGAMFVGLQSTVANCFTTNPKFNLGCTPYPFSENPERHKNVIELDDVWMVSADTKVKAAVFEWSKFLYEMPQAQRWADKAGLVMVQKGIDTSNQLPYIQELVAAQKSGQTVQNCIPQPIGEFVPKWRSYMQAWISDKKTRTTQKLIDEGQAIYDEIIKGLAK